MKIKNIGVILLFASILFANNKSIVDNTHKTAVKALDENIEVLPNSMQKTTQELVNDIKKDGKNLNFIFKLTNISHQTNFFNNDTIWADPTITQYLLATIGVRLLPNTWKIELSYTKELGRNLFFKDSRSGDNITSYSIDEGNINLSYINFYTKPIATNYGDLGFGYMSVKQSETMMAENLKMIDTPNVSTGNARYTTKSEYFYLTYNIPGKNKWYSGFGLSYTFGNSNQSAISKDGANVVIKPDTDFTQIDIGINKTLDEVNQGLSFKTLTCGTRTSKATYYNYDNNTNESYKRDYSTINMDLIYMFKPKKDKQIYASLKYSNSAGTYEEYEEIQVEVSLLF